jgi:hypothetical protein
MIRLQSEYYNVMVTQWLVSACDIEKPVSKAASYSMATWYFFSYRYVTNRNMDQIISQFLF